MKIVSTSIARPVSVLIFAVAAVVFGVVAFRDLAVDLLPDISYPSLTVRTEYEGTAPAEVETLLTRPVEEAVGVVNNVVRVTSSSRADTSEVTLELAWGTDMDFAAMDVRERLDMLRLPPGARAPVLLRFDPSLDPIMRIALSGPGDLARLRFVAEDRVKRALERLDGVAAVVVSGGLEEEIQVELDERRLASLGLTEAQVRSRLAAENINLTGGRLREGETEYLVRTVHEFVRADDMRRVVVQRQGDAIVRLEDVANVFTGHKEREIITRVDGAEAVELAVYKEGGTNTVTVSDTVRARLEEIGGELRAADPTLAVGVVSDQARYIRQSVREVLESAAYGGVLAVVVLFGFLRNLHRTAIISVAIPVSVVATFFLMYTSGISLNIMSLGGLSLGVGMLVDNAIVVLEAIQRKREEGHDAVRAADEGTSEVGRAITASTLTTICVFVPIVFVEGIAAQLFRDQALTVAFALAVSLVVALTLIPMLASRRAKPAAPAADERSSFFLSRLIGGALAAVAGGVRRIVVALIGGMTAVLRRVFAPLLDGFDRALAATTEGYERAVTAVLRRPLATIGITAALLLGSLLLWPLLGRELIPELVQGELAVTVELPPGTRLEVTERQLDGLAAFIHEQPGVEMVYAVAGIAPEQGGVAGETRENVGQVSVRMAPPISREREEALMAAVRGHLDAEEQALGAAFPDLVSPDRRLVAYRFSRPSYFSFRSAVEVEIRGDNLELLERLAGEAAGRMRTIGGLADVKASTEGGYPELQVHFNRDRLAAYGLSVSDVATVLRAKVQGEVVTDITRPDRTIDIRMRTAETYRDSTADLANLSVAARGAVAVPLSSVAEVSELEGPAEVRRSDGSRVARITANLAGRDLGSVTSEMRERFADIPWPAGYDWKLSGQEQEMQSSFSSMRLAIGLAIFMVYLVMASQFESLLHPFVILFSVPFAVIGVLVTMAVFSVTVSVVSLIGMVLLAGIVVNNAIVLVDYTNQLRRDGVPKLEALARAGRVRLRPILMTTGTTVLGLLPMAIGLGEGSELRTPMALVVIGGLVTSTLLTLLVVPAVYATLDRSR